MRVISIARLRTYWGNSSFADSEGPLRAWHTHVNNRKVQWQSWGDVKADYASASIVGRCVVFNIGGNKYRLITRILYEKQKVFILKVMTHVEYDEEKWKKECQCYESPPPQKATGPVPVRQKKTDGKDGGKKYGK